MSENLKKVIEMLSESIFQKHHGKTITQYMKDETWNAICNLSDHQERGRDISIVRLKHVINDCKWHPSLCEMVACIMLGKKIIIVIPKDTNSVLGNYAKKGTLVILEGLEASYNQDAITIMNQAHFKGLINQADIESVSLNSHQIARDIKHFETYCVD